MSEIEQPLALSAAAQAVGVSERSLRNWIVGKDSAGKAVPLLPFVLVKGRPHVLVSVAVDHIRRHASRLPKGLHSTVAPSLTAADHQSAGPGGPIPPALPAELGTVIDPEIRAALGGADPLAMDQHELMQKLAIAGVNIARVRVIVQAVNAIQRKRDSEQRAGRHISPDDVVRMLRSYAELFIEHVDEGAPRTAAELLRFMREHYGVDLGMKHPAIGAQLEDFFRAQQQKTIEAIRRNVDEQTHTVQRLEF